MNFMKSFAVASAGLLVMVAGCKSPVMCRFMNKEYHVSVSGNDANDGSKSAMLRTISAAALKAQPGDVITVHAGVYRETISPPRGGESDSRRIVYQAAKGAKVEVKGSEQIKTWEKVEGDVWKVTLPNSFFGGFNPYKDLIHGDWFDPRGRQHFSGAVYLNGSWLLDAKKLDDVLKPAGLEPQWFGQVDKDNTIIWAQFKGVNPNEQLVEINVRQTVFYPEKTGINYITVRGFTLEHAATPWAPPSAEQKGLIGTHWSKGWIIEDNVIRYSRCSGIALGKYGDEFDNTNAAGTADPYTECVRRALSNGWNKATVGSHIVRRNTISHCEQTGIVGSLGCSFSTITDNTIHDIHVRRLFAGAEMAAIKLHGAIDVLIAGNHIHHSNQGIWLDWMAQGARVTGNLIHDNLDRDLFFEVNHGPFLVDNNILLSPTAILSCSQGGAYVHNLICGGIAHWVDSRMTPFQELHSTAIAGLHDNMSGDDRYYNNVIVKRMNLTMYDNAKFPVWMDGNVFLQGAVPSKHEKDPLVRPESDPGIKLVEKEDGYYLEGRFDKAWGVERTRKLVTTGLLGKAVIPGAAYEAPDGSPISVDTDYFKGMRNKKNPYPGAFEVPVGGQLSLRVWPVMRGR